MWKKLFDILSGMSLIVILAASIFGWGCWIYPLINWMTLKDMFFDGVAIVLTAFFAGIGFEFGMYLTEKQLENHRRKEQK